jgi:hypothetical protein
MSVRTPDILGGMPNQPKNKHRPVRFSDDDWDDLGRLAEQMGTDRSAVLRQLAQWWMRRRGARPPARPPVSDDVT